MLSATSSTMVVGINMSQQFIKDKSKVLQICFFVEQESIDNHLDVCLYSPRLGRKRVLLRNIYFYLPPSVSNIPAQVCLKVQWLASMHGLSMNLIAAKCVCQSCIRPMRDTLIWQRACISLAIQLFFVANLAHGHKLIHFPKHH